jgi:beta-lactam-binding protein with PASTA domain
VPVEHIGQRAVPDVTGESDVVAESTLLTSGLLFDYGTSEYSGSVALGGIISQSPLAGVMAEAGDVVTLIRSLGVRDEDAVTVPYLIGKTLSVALERIAGVFCEADATGTAGSVVSQDPAPFTVVARGTTISIVMGGAVNHARHPNAKGLPPYMGREAA